MKLTRSHLFFILLITIMSVAFLPDLIEGLENLSSGDRKHTINEYYKSGGENDVRRCKKTLMTYLLDNPSCRKLAINGSITGGQNPFPATKGNGQYQSGANAGGKHLGQPQQQGQNNMPINNERVNGGSLESQQRLPFSVEDNDLYILKTKIVPPVCPKCPDIPCGVCSKNNKNQERANEESISNEVNRNRSKNAMNHQKETRASSDSRSPGIMEAANRNDPYNPQNNRDNYSGLSNNKGNLYKGNAPIARLASFAQFE